MANSNSFHENLPPNQLLNVKNRLDDEFQYLLTAQQTLQQTSEGGTVEDIQERISALKQQLMKESTDRSYRELLLKRSEMGKLMCTKLISDEDLDSAVKNSLEKLELAQQVLRIEKETSELKEKLHEQEQANFKLKTENLELLGKLKESKEKAALPTEVTQSTEYKRLKSELQVRSQSIIICQNLIKILFYGLGLNVEEDKELEELLEKCNESYRF